MRNKLISTLFVKGMHWADFSFLVFFIEKKISVSYLRNQHEGFVKQFLRIFKYLYTLVRAHRLKQQEELHFSLPYFAKDVASFPEKVVSITSAGITIFQLILIVCKAIPVALLLVTFPGVKNKSIIFGAILVGYIYYCGVKNSQIKKIHFHSYSYVLDVMVLVYLFKKDGEVESHFHEYVSFVDHTTYIICDHLYHPNEIASRFAQKNRDVFVADYYHFDVSSEKLLQTAKLIKQDTKGNKVLGLYSSGFYCRPQGYLDSDLIQQGIQREAAMCELVEGYAKLHSDVEVVIFIHMARGVEPYEAAQKHYAKILMQPNITLMDKNAASKDSFDQVDIGLTVNSNVFWDRLYLGYKTLLFMPYICPEFVEQTGLSDIALNSGLEDSLERLDYYLNLTEVEFIHLVTR